MKNWQENEALVPEIIFKYRDWNRTFDKGIITHGKIHFSKPSTFGDYLDCNVPYRYDLLTPEYLYDYFYAYSKRCNKNFTKEQHIRFANLHTTETNLNKESFWDTHREKERKRLDEGVGIFCASRIHDNFNLWNKFANGEGGFCVGIDPNAIMNDERIAGIVADVEYYTLDNPPVIMPIRPTLEEERKDLMTLIFSLQAQWHKEKEIRFCKFNPIERTIELPKDAIKVVYLAQTISSSIKSEIIQAAFKLNSKIEVIQM